jgi:small-conductance mechanosensitive channel
VGGVLAVLANWQNWLWSLLTVGLALLAGLIAHRVVFAAAARFARGTRSAMDESLVRHSRKPARLIFPVLAVFLAAAGMPLPPHLVQAFRHFTVLVLIGATAWLAIALLHVIEDQLAIRYRIDVADNLTARRIETQVHVLRRVVILAIGTVAFSAMLMTFPSIWNIGAGLFASAGAAGLVIGMAARPTLSNLLAGVQIALTEPIRLDDVVIVEGEWGWIEEIQTTYVVVRIWDLRRLVVPLSYFIEKPFQNWTRTSAALLGTVFLYLDYTVPVEEVRLELHNILKSSELWDGKVWGIQVTNTSERAMELRALMSAPDSGKAWDLRCYVREKLIAFLQQRYPQSLPRMRAELLGEPSGDRAAQANSRANPG